MLLRALPVFLLFLLQAADKSNTAEERLWHYRNLGKAFYENPTTQVQAIDEFKKALELAPTSARNLLLSRTFVVRPNSSRTVRLGRAMVDRLRSAVAVKPLVLRGQQGGGFRKTHLTPTDEQRTGIIYG